MRNYLNNWELPSLAPFILTTKDSNATVTTYERNPYFWAVDTEGNQLPYIDRVQLTSAESNDAVIMRTVAGENDLGLAVIRESFSNYPLYMENAKAGNYTVRLREADDTNAMNIHINMNSQDPAKRVIMGKTEFRQALSLALDRDRIISIQFTLGPVKASPRNNGPVSASPYFDLNPTLPSAYARFNQAEANRLLDGLGLNRKNAAGKRLLPNGQALTMVIDVPNFDSTWIESGNLVAECWQAVGIDATARSIDSALWSQRWQSNDYDVSMQTGGEAYLIPSASAINKYTGWYGGINWTHIFMVGNIIYRRTEGKEGFAPDADIQRLWELGKNAASEVDENKRKTMITEIFKIHEKNLYILGICTRMPYPHIVKNSLKNVPPLNDSWDMGHGGHGRPSQYYFE
jgi:peptide/nickel transport system substrate-binding protein